MSFKYKFKNLIFIIFQLIFFYCFIVYNSFADDKFFKENLGEDLFKESSSNDDLLNDEDIKKVLGGASYEAKQSWKNVPQDKLQCIKIGLKINNTSLDNLISEGIGPSDNKMSSFNKICSDILNQKLRFNVSCKLNDEQGKSYYSKCNESLITIKNDKIVKLTKLQAMKVMFNGGEVRTYKEITKEAARKREQKLAQKLEKQKLKVNKNFTNYSNISNNYDYKLGKCLAVVGQAYDRKIVYSFNQPIQNLVTRNVNRVKRLTIPSFIKKCGYVFVNGYTDNAYTSFYSCVKQRTPQSDAYFITGFSEGIQISMNINSLQSMNRTIRNFCSVVY